MKKSLNILILDDDNICNFINTRIAQTSGFFNHIQSMFNGKDALEKFDQVCKGELPAPDIILLDLNMPVMNGFDFIRSLQCLKNIPNRDRLTIIILTSSENEIDKQNASSFGIRHYLTKPLTLKDLQSVVFSLNEDNTGLPEFSTTTD